MTLRIKRMASRLLNRLGYEIKGYGSNSHISKMRLRVMEQNHINVVWDVGAGEGKYIQMLRRAGYEGRVISFEPIKEVYERLDRNASGDNSWICKNFAAGNKDGATVIHVSENSVSSSLLPITQKHVSVVAETQYVRAEETSMVRLDSVRAQLLDSGARVLLKLDVQGFEIKVLLGAEQTLSQTYVIETELSLLPLYEGQPLYREVIDFLESKGYDLVSLERGFCDYETGQLLQMDGIFARRAPA